METDEMTVSQSLRDEAKGYNETGISISPNVAIMAADTIDALVAALETIATETDVRKSQVLALDALALACKGG